MIHPRSRRRGLAGTVVFVAFLTVLGTPSRRPARAVGVGTGIATVGNAPGVLIDADGFVHARETEAGKDLADMRTRARMAADAAKAERIAFVSLPKLFAEVKAATDANRPVPESLKYLGGLTQLRYVFVYPDEHDLVIGGPAEPFTVEGANAVGKRSGRPVLQLDDLVTAMRTARQGNGQLFGCGIYPDPKSLKVAEDIALRMAARPRQERADALQQALGPQEVRVFGTRSDCRLAAVCVAADYKLKRLALGLDRVPTVPIGNAIDRSRSAANKYWFKASFDPLLVTPDGNGYQVRGNRLAVEAGMFDFDPRGATETAKQWVTKFSKDMPDMAAAVPVFAELQNVADLALLANLVRVDRLDQRAGWDVEWLMDERAYAVATVPVPKTAQTLVNFTNGSMAAGGVIMQVMPSIGRDARQSDEKGTIAPVRQQSLDLRKAAKDGGPVVAPLESSPTTKPIRTR